MDDLISIIVPVFNVEKYLHNCINSILNQTYQNIEVILVDDGSNDSSPLICDKFAKTDKRVRVIHKKNGGLSDARNIGLDNARGEYVSFVDSDDTIDCTFIMNLVALLKKYDADISQVSFMRIYEDGTDKEYFQEETKEMVYSNLEMLFTFYDKSLGPDATIACNKLYKKILFNDIYYPVGKINEDEATTYKLIYKASKIAVSTKKLYYYLQRNDSIMRSGFNNNRYHIIEIMEDKNTFFSNKGLTELYMTNMIYNLQLLAELYIYAKKNKENKFNLKFIKMKFQKNYDKIINSNLLRYKDKFLLRRAKHSFYYYHLHNVIKEKIKRGKLKLKLQIKKCVENYNRMFLLYLTLKSTNKVEHKIHLSEYKTLKNKFEDIRKKHKKVIIFIATPSHGNLGDQAIVYSEYKLLNDIGVKENIIEINEYQYDLYQREIAKLIKKEDLIVIDGGGNIGTLWMAPENRILNIVIRFKKNKIIIFPQSAYFANTYFGNNEKEKVKKIFNGHNNLHLMIRDKNSYLIIRDVYNKHLYFVPDIVLYNQVIKFSNLKRDKCLIMERRDHETLQENELSNLAMKITSDYNLSIENIDNIVKKNINSKNREDELFNQLKKIASAKILITNRLHGMIFAYITNTPCIVYDNISKKISGVYETWLKNENNIILVNNTGIDYDNLKRILNNAYENNTDLNEEFHTIKKICKDILDLDIVS